MTRHLVDVLVGNWELEGALEVEDPPRYRSAPTPGGDSIETYPLICPRGVLLQMAFERKLSLEHDLHIHVDC